MGDRDREEVTVSTLHEDLETGFADLKGEVRGGFTDLKGEVQAGFADLKAGIADVKVTLVTGFRNMPTREDSQEMIRLLRENIRLQEERPTQLDARMREQHFETHQIPRSLAQSQRAMSEEVRGLSADIKALIARLDALIKDRGDGGSTA
ncbi:MAG: hypothetical protein HY712_01370 [candidate division NC10 bacterium]|nr:hypothetical protein [candidate division NC10 bacterium]